jgi:hypothetical protein
MAIPLLDLAVIITVVAIASVIGYKYNQWALRTREGPNFIEWVEESFEELHDHSQHAFKKAKTINIKTKAKSWHTTILNYYKKY